MQIKLKDTIPTLWKLSNTDEIGTSQQRNIYELHKVNF